MFPPGPWSLAGLQEWCQTIYGPLLVPRPDVLPGSFGLLRDLPRFAATTTRLIFSSGTVRCRARARTCLSHDSVVAAAAPPAV